MTEPCRYVERGSWCGAYLILQERMWVCAGCGKPLKVANRCCVKCDEPIPEDNLPAFCGRCFLKGN